MKKLLNRTLKILVLRREHDEGLFAVVGLFLLLPASLGVMLLLWCYQARLQLELPAWCVSVMLYCWRSRRTQEDTSADQS